MFEFEDYFGLSYKFPIEEKANQKQLIKDTCQYSSDGDYGIVYFTPQKLYISKYLDTKLKEKGIYINNKCFSNNNYCSSTGKFTGWFILKDNIMYLEPMYSNIAGVSNQRWYKIDLENGTIDYIYFYSNYVGNDFFHYYNCYFSEKLSQQVFNNQIQVGTNYYDDFMHYKKPSEIITAMFYFLIPVLIVIFLIKVFRKGIH